MPTGGGVNHFDIWHTILGSSALSTSIVAVCQRRFFPDRLIFGLRDGKPHA